MADDLKKWDTSIAPYLGRIYECATRAEYYIDEINHALSVLKSRPNFETKAESAMRSALLKLGVAITIYQKKPTEKRDEG